MLKNISPRTNLYNNFKSYVGTDIKMMFLKEISKDMLEFKLEGFMYALNDLLSDISGLRISIHVDSFQLYADEILIKEYSVKDIEHLKNEHSFSYFMFIEWGNVLSLLSDHISREQISFAV